MRHITPAQPGPAHPGLAQPSLAQPSLAQPSLRGRLAPLACLVLAAFALSGCIIAPYYPHARPLYYYR